MHELTTQLTAPPPAATSTESEYFHGNYRDCVRPGMGIEMLYDLLGSVSGGGRWVDFGAGPFSALWGLGLPRADQLTAVDISPLSLWLNNHHWSDLLDSTYVASLIDAGLVTGTVRDGLRVLPRRYFVGDMFERERHESTEPDAIHDAGIVTAIGLLGLARDDGEVAMALYRVRRAIRLDGWFVGASWLRHRAPTPTFALDWPDGLGKIAARAGLVLQEARTARLAGDSDFATVLGWTMRVAIE